MAGVAVRSAGADLAIFLGRGASPECTEKERENAGQSRIGILPKVAAQKRLAVYHFSREPFQVAELTDRGQLELWFCSSKILISWLLPCARHS